MIYVWTTTLHSFSLLGPYSRGQRQLWVIIKWWQLNRHVTKVRTVHCSHAIIGLRTSRCHAQQWIYSNANVSDRRFGGKYSVGSRETVFTCDSAAGWVTVIMIIFSRWTKRRSNAIPWANLDGGGGREGGSNGFKRPRVEDEQLNMNDVGLVERFTQSHPRSFDLQLDDKIFIHSSLFYLCSVPFHFRVKIGKIVILTKKWYNFGNELYSFTHEFQVARECAHS